MRKGVKERRELGRHKVCLNCRVEFCSIVPNGYRTPKEVSCSKECACRFSVEKRRQKGTYTKNEQAIEKMHATKLAKNPDYGKKWAARKQEIKERGLGGFDKQKYKHWAQVPENKEYLKNMSKGRIVNEASKTLMSLARQKLLKEHPELIYSNANGGKREDLNGQYFRSNWEANYARILNEQKIAWKYEPETFQLSNGTSYTPDFKIDENKFIELKGWYDNDSKQKIELFLKEYPQYELDLIGETEYYSLRNLFKHKIPKWEGR
jgi:hypothetical protein